MDIFKFILFVYFSTGLREGLCQIIAPIETENNCFNGILKANCSQESGRAFIKKLSAGVKYTSEYSETNTSMCPPYWTTTVIPECCARGPNDCYGEYIAVNTDPYILYKDCVGENKCSHRSAPSMDTIYLHCNSSIYPLQTAYFNIEFYCIDVNVIGELSNAGKQNDGQGSLIYLWSGTSTSYPELPVATYTCSVETDCDDTISVISLDFRFSDVNLTCLENTLKITDGSSFHDFNCTTSNNNFKIQTLYTSRTNYITLKYTGITAGGHLWLGFSASSKGNLTLNCGSQSPINTCVSETTTDELTTSTTTTVDYITTETLTTTGDLTTAETTAGDLTTAETTRVDLTTAETTAEHQTTYATDENHTSAENATKSDIQHKVDAPADSTSVIIGVVVGLAIVALAAMWIYILFRKYRQNKAAKEAAVKEQNNLQESSMEKGQQDISKNDSGATVIPTLSKEGNGYIRNENEYFESHEASIETMGKCQDLFEKPLPAITGRNVDINLAEKPLPAMMAKEQESDIFQQPSCAKTGGNQERYESEQNLPAVSVKQTVSYVLEQHLPAIFDKNEENYTSRQPDRTIIGNEPEQHLPTIIEQHTEDIPIKEENNPKSQYSVINSFPPLKTEVFQSNENRKKKKRNIDNYGIKKDNYGIKNEVSGDNIDNTIDNKEHAEIVEVQSYFKETIEKDALKVRKKQRKIKGETTTLKEDDVLHYNSVEIQSTFKETIDTDVLEVKEKKRKKKKKKRTLTENDTLRYDYVGDPSSFKETKETDELEVKKTKRKRKGEITTLKDDGDELQYDFVGVPPSFKETKEPEGLEGKKKKGKKKRETTILTEDDGLYYDFVGVPSSIKQTPETDDLEVKRNKRMKRREKRALKIHDELQYDFVGVPSSFKETRDTEEFKKEKKTKRKKIKSNQVDPNHLQEVPSNLSKMDLKTIPSDAE